MIRRKQRRKDLYDNFNYIMKELFYLIQIILLKKKFLMKRKHEVLCCRSNTRTRKHAEALYIVHGDLKLVNIPLLDEPGHVKE
jgi:hypothetical protein